jgi:membrane-associated phospholipid phosphatase
MNANPLIIFDYIGHYGPPILFALTCYSLFHRNVYLLVFVIGSMVNYMINIFLKETIREPRPENPLEFIDSHNLIGNNYYGLPSGHAQITLFSLTFFYLTNGYERIYTLFVMTCITIITLYQRWKYRRHTIKQLYVGSIIGATIAWTLVLVTKQYLHD